MWPAIIIGGSVLLLTGAVLWMGSKVNEANTNLKKVHADFDRFKNGIKLINTLVDD
jgi:hypothetical protein